MLKLYIVLALVVAVASAQNAQPGSEAAPEPYSYGYETDSHSAAEQRDPSGKVTGFYTLVDADGRQRRVEYIADEAGFRAKVQTNEVGTKSENSADVEMLASPPTEAQYAPAPVQAAPAVQSVARTVQVNQAAPARSQAISFGQQQAGYGNYNGQYGYGAYPAGYGYNSLYGQSGQYGQYSSQPYGYGYTSYSSAPSGYGYGYASSPVGYGYTSGYSSGSVGNYNNHLPSQYYRSVQSGSPAGAYVVGGSNGNSVNGVRYVTSSVPAGSYQNQGSYRSYSSQTGPVVPSSGQSRGSSNYIVLQKREAEKNSTK